MSQLESLVQEIEELNSTEFERFGYIFTDALSGQHLHHRGLTPRGQPRGYTVDSYSEDGSIAGEYSIDKDYFSNLSKPKKDIQHVLKEFPQVKTIYLLAGTRLQPSEGKEMVKLCTDMEKIFQGKIIWYDAEKIAESIISNLLTRMVTINRLAKFLPSLINIYSTHPDTVSLPQLPANYRISSKTLEDSYCLLTSKRFLLLTGISGIGKSNLAVKLAQKLLENEHLDAVYFINSTEIQSYRELSAVSCEAGGRKINLPGTLQTRRSLVILDDLRHKLDEILESLQNLATDSSYIIVTSQISSYYAEQIGAEFHVPYLNDENLVDKIVNWRLPQKQRCSKELIHLITEKTRGYPLLLNFIRSSLFYEELKTDEIETLLTDMATVEVDGEKELMFRLLSRHEQAIRKGLLCIQWLNCQYISEALLAKLAVVLAAYEELYTINDIEANKNYYFLDKFSSFKDAISSMAVESFDQPYKVLAKTMKFYTYQHPDQALFLMNSVPIPSTETIRRDSCFAVAQMYKEAGKALMWYTTPDLEQAKRYYNAAEEFYRTAPSAMLCRNYESIQRAENLILLEHFSEAEEYLRLHEFKSSPFWNYRMGQSLAHGGEESAKCALYYLQTAVDLLTEKEKEKYLSAFLQERAKVLAQLRDPQAKCCFDESLKYCQNDKHKQQILRDIEEIKGQLKEVVRGSVGVTMRYNKDRKR